MFYQRLFFTVNLNLVNYLCCDRPEHFRIAKVKRDLKQPDSMVVFFYFNATEKLMSAVEDYFKDHQPSECEILQERLSRAESGIWGR